MPGSDKLELLLRLRVKARDTFREHLGQVIARLNLSTVHEAQQQRVALGRCDVLQLGGVQYLGLTSKVADLRCAQPVEKRTLVAEQLQPAQVRDEIVEVRQGRSRGWLFETIEHAPSWWLGFQKAIQEPTFLFGEAPDDQLEEASMDERPYSTNQTVQRAEGGQFEALAHQFLDGDVDQISRMVLYLGRLADRRRGDMKCIRFPRAHLQELANGRVMAIERADSDVERRIRREAHAGAYVRHDGEWHVLQARQITKPLHAFQQNGDRKRRRWPTRALADEDEFLGRGRIDLAQLLS